jgi:NADH pyrophosphatase NudC (nudix superfamily)
MQTLPPFFLLRVFFWFGIFLLLICMVDGFQLAHKVTMLSFPDSILEASLLFVYCNDLILVQKSNQSAVFPSYIYELRPNSVFTKPFLSFLQEIGESWRFFHFASYQQLPCYLLYSENKAVIDANTWKEDFRNQYYFAPLRQFFYKNPDPRLLVAGLANQIYHWDLDHKYCGRCAAQFQFHSNEFSKLCPNCGNVQYPQIAPAIIVAIEKEDKILLAHNHRFGKNFFSILAGFSNVGETLEETLVREVEEEVGIQVKNLQYIGSQPWPFPNSLMLGFHAEWMSGDIECDGIEIETAQWFSLEDLQQIDLPSKVSISRQLIDRFIEFQQNKQKKSKNE